MAIDAQCPHCRKLLRAPEKKAGHQVNCPHCQQPIIVPSKAAAHSVLQTAGGGPLLRPVEASVSGFAGAAAESATASSVQNVATTEHGTSPLEPTKSNGAPAAGAASLSTSLSRTPLTRATDASWYMRTPDDQLYGPVQRDELDRWVGEGRVDAECQILCDGWEQWKWASDIYPQLVGSKVQAPEVPIIEAVMTASPFPRFEGTQAASLAETGSNSPTTSNRPTPLPSSTATSSATAQKGFLSAQCRRIDVRGTCLDRNRCRSGSRECRPVDGAWWHRRIVRSLLASADYTYLCYAEHRGRNVPVDDLRLARGPSSSGDKLVRVSWHTAAVGSKGLDSRSGRRLVRRFGNCDFGFNSRVGT